MKQRVIIVTKFYYRRGGDCIYALNLEKMLREHGHEVAVFAMKYPDNDPSQWSAYWPAEVTFSGGITQRIAAMKRTMGIGEVASQFSRLMHDFRPHVVHLNNIHSYLSPVVATLAAKAGARVVWTLHDYKLLCPAYSCMRQGHTCELCFTDKSKVLTTRCMKGSLAASTLAYVEALRWSRTTLQRHTDAFICPSAFMAEKMRQGRFDPNRLITLCNFIAPSMLSHYSSADPLAGNTSPYYCYIGRLSEEKGVRTLLEAASQLPYTLKVAGDGPLAQELTQRYAHNPRIQLLGRLDATQILQLLSHARLSVMPSECYENNPLGVIESLCTGTPVVGARIGGIPELIDNTRGLTYKSGDTADLMHTITQAWDTPFDRTAIQTDALQAFSPETYYTRLIDIYSV